MVQSIEKTRQQLFQVAQSGRVMSIESYSTDSSLLVHRIGLGGQIRVVPGVQDVVVQKFHFAIGCLLPHSDPSKIAADPELSEVYTRL